MATYDLKEYLYPLWKAKRIVHETAMLVGEDDSAPLLFTPDKVEKVTDYGQQTVYALGKDYTVSGNRIVPIKGGAMPYMEREVYYRDTPASIMKNGKEEPLPITVMPEKLREDIRLEGKRYFAFGRKDIFNSKQISVTYTHSGEWNKYIPEGYADVFKGFFERVKAGEKPTLLFYGDSITTGCDSSGANNFIVEPAVDSFAVMVHKYLSEKFGEINYVNTAVGGWNSRNAVANFEERVIAHKPDLLILGFGMNDGRFSTQEYHDLYVKMLNRLREVCPDTPVLLVGTMIPNFESDWYGVHRYFVDELYKLQGEYKDIGVCNMTKFSIDVYDMGKRFRDMTGNNVNHPNDFMARMYGQLILKALLGDEFEKDFE